MNGLLETTVSLFLETPEVQEGELILRACAGDKAAFGELVSMYHRRVINIVYRMCGDALLAEDAAQTAFLNAWQRLHQYRSSDPARLEASFRSWLFRIAVNAAIDIHRRSKPQVDLDSVNLVDSAEGIESSLVRQERIGQVRRAVLGLPEASRAVLVLREYESLSYREIAETLDIPLGTVMSRLNYARSSLAQTLRMYLEES